MFTVHDHVAGNSSHASRLSNEVIDGLTGTGREESRKSIDLGQPDLPQDDIIDEVSSITTNVLFQKAFRYLNVFTTYANSFLL